MTSRLRFPKFQSQDPLPASYPRQSQSHQSKSRVKPIAKTSTKPIARTSAKPNQLNQQNKHSVSFHPNKVHTNHIHKPQQPTRAVSRQPQSKQPSSRRVVDSQTLAMNSVKISPQQHLSSHQQSRSSHQQDVTSGNFQSRQLTHHSAHHSASTSLSYRTDGKHKIGKTETIGKTVEGDKTHASRRINRNVDSYVSITDNQPSTTQEICDSKFEKQVPTIQEKSHTEVQYEVSSSRPPNLNLSTYGYSVNASESTRRKAIQDAMRTEGTNAVQIRLLFLIKKYQSEEVIVHILSADLKWAKDIEKQSEQREQRDRERNKSRMRIFQRMQEKSKHRR